LFRQEGAAVKLGRLNHVGVAVPDLEAARAFWRETMGGTEIGEPFDMPEQGVRVCFVDTPNGGTQVELLAPLSPESPVAGFLARNPAGGQHHLCFEVPDIEAARFEFERMEKRILDTHRGARDADLLRPPEGHGRHPDRDHGNAALRGPGIPFFVTLNLFQGPSCRHEMPVGGA
jgi:methylmalonyl-CoA/ethylmalonyl-CoA epimerase